MVVPITWLVEQLSNPNRLDTSLPERLNRAKVLLLPDWTNQAPPPLLKTIVLLQLVASQNLGITFTQMVVLTNQ
jgi:hypothetical protein